MRCGLCEAAKARTRCRLVPPRASAPSAFFSAWRAVVASRTSRALERLHACHDPNLRKPHLARTATPRVGETRRAPQTRCVRAAPARRSVCEQAFALPRARRLSETPGKRSRPSAAARARCAPSVCAPFARSRAEMNAPAPTTRLCRRVLSRVVDRYRMPVFTAAGWLIEAAAARAGRRRSESSGTALVSWGVLRAAAHNRSTLSHHKGGEPTK